MEMFWHSFDCQRAGVLLLLCIGLANDVYSQCTVDSNLSKYDQNVTIGIIQMLEPLHGKRTDIKGVTGSGDQSGRDFILCVCCDCKSDTPNATVLDVTISDQDPVILGLRERTLATFGDDWLELRFMSTTNYSSGACIDKPLSSRLKVLCDEDEDEETPFKVSVSPVLDSDCYVQFTTHHSLACTDKPEPPSLGGFAIFLILLTVAFGCYLIFGFAYLRFIKGAKGIDQIPHRLFWFGIGNSFSDCIGLMCRCDRYCGQSHSPDEYRSVDSSNVPSYDPTFNTAATLQHQLPPATPTPGLYQTSGGYNSIDGEQHEARRSGSDTDLLN